MSTKIDFSKDYSAGPDTTDVIKFTMSGQSLNLIIALLLITDDVTASPAQLIDATYSLSWNGTSISNVSKITGFISDVFTWSVNGGTATLSITPSASSPGGFMYANAIILPDLGTVDIDY
jgi:hypothetical protein